MSRFGIAVTGTCSSCRRSFPRSALVGHQALKGSNGRREDGPVLLCGPCSAARQGGGSGDAAVASLIGLAVLGLIVAAVRGH
jgi:hypothetical protein